MRVSGIFADAFAAGPAGSHSRAGGNRRDWMDIQ